MVPCILLIAAVIHQAKGLMEGITTDSTKSTVDIPKINNMPKDKLWTYKIDLKNELQVNNRSNHPLWFLLNSCDVPCPKFMSEDLICGSNGNTYLNICEFEKAKCKNGMLTIRNKGKCQGDVLFNLRKGLKHLDAVIKSKMQMAANKSGLSKSLGSGNDGPGNKEFRESNTVSKLNANGNEINLNENKSNLASLAESGIALNVNKNEFNDNKEKYSIVTISIPAPIMPCENETNDLSLKETITVSNTDEKIRNKITFLQTSNVSNRNKNGTSGNKSNNIKASSSNPAPTNFNGNRNNERTPIVTDNETNSIKMTMNEPTSIINVNEINYPSMTDCTNGWVPYGSKCYKHFSVLKTWIQSRRDCQQYKGDLASSSSQDINMFLSFLCSSFSWLGGINTAFFARLIPGIGSDWVWVDASPWKWTSWDTKNSTNVTKSNKHCLVTSESGKWQNDVCTRQHQYICQRNIQLTTPML